MGLEERWEEYRRDSFEKERRRGFPSPVGASPQGGRGRKSEGRVSEKKERKGEGRIFISSRLNLSGKGRRAVLC